MQTEKYVVGSGEKAPQWLNNASARGIVRFQNGENESITVNTVSGVKVAVAGDVILHLPSGLAVLTGAQARKYKVVRRKRNENVE